MATVAWNRLDAWTDALSAQGFALDPGTGAYRRRGATVAAEGRWLVLRKPLRRSAHVGQGQFGQPGLWKVAQADGHAEQLFEVPLSLVREEDGPADLEGEDAPPFGAALSWAMATARGGLPAGWEAPPHDLVEAWAPAGDLTVQAGDHARQGQLVLEASRLAVRFPILRQLPAELPPPRMAWLRKLLAEAQSRWRMVRVGLVDDPGEASAQAEVDLSGAPLALLEGLLSTALTALRCVVAWVVAPAVLVADTAHACRVFELSPEPGMAHERR